MHEDTAGRKRPTPAGGNTGTAKRTAGDVDAPRPFLKWVGGKRQLVARLKKFAPADFGTFHEPFLGGGALFFDGVPDRPILTDNNRRLIRTYWGVRDSVTQVIDLLREYNARHCKKFFLETRARDIDKESDAELAAWFIYLNRTGYNGLYRVNRRNLFNVPFGDYSNPTICDAANLRACSRALQRADIRCCSFETVRDRAIRGDFVYFDPPYIPLSTSSSFRSYTSDGFTAADQVKLRDVALELAQMGVNVLLSNSSAPEVSKLYAKPHFKVVNVPAARSVNCRADGRGKIQESVITCQPTGRSIRHSQPS